MAVLSMMTARIWVVMNWKNATVTMICLPAAAMRLCMKPTLP